MHKEGWRFFLRVLRVWEEAYDLISPLAIFSLLNATMHVPLNETLNVALDARLHETLNSRH